MKITNKGVHDLKDDDVYWCTADVGWVTGHSYIVYGHRISTMEVESALVSHPAVAEAAVVGKDDEDKGQASSPTSSSSRAVKAARS